MAIETPTYPRSPWHHNESNAIFLLACCLSGLGQIVPSPRVTFFLRYSMLGAPEQEPLIHAGNFYNYLCFRSPAPRAQSDTAQQSVNSGKFSHFFINLYSNDKPNIRPKQNLKQKNARSKSSFFYFIELLFSYKWYLCRSRFYARVWKSNDQGHTRSPW